MIELDQARDAVYRGIAEYDCIERVDFLSAASIPSNIKYNLDKIPENSPEFSLIVGGITIIASDFNPDAISAAPNGGNRWAAPVAESLGVPFVRLEKAPRNRYMVGKKAWTPEVRKAYKMAEDVVVVEDAFSTGSSVLRLARFLGQRRIVASVGILGRGEEREGIETLEQSVALAKAEHGRRPPAYIKLPFPRLFLTEIPTPMMQESANNP